MAGPIPGSAVGQAASRAVWLGRAGRLAVAAPARTGAAPVGERVWLWCPPGVAAEDLEDETERLRAACVAREVRVARDLRWSALVVIDVIRRDTLSPKRVIPAPITQHIREAPPGSEPAESKKTNKKDTKQEVKTSG